MGQRVNLDIDVLRTFVTGIELGSYASAANRLGRSPSAISAQLQKLEEKAGQTLFRKEGRGLVLTEAGETMLSYARRILSINDEAILAVKGSGVEGWVKLGLPLDLADNWLPAVLAQFGRGYPKSRIEVRVGRSAELIRHVNQGELDIAIIWGDAEKALCAQNIATVPIVWIASANFVASTFTENTPLPLIAFDAPCMFRSAAITALDEMHIPWRVTFTSPSLAGVWAATSAGLGITIRTPINMPAGVRALIPAESGLPYLPKINLTLVTSEANLPPAASQLSNILVDEITSRLLMI